MRNSASKNSMTLLLKIVLIDRPYYMTFFVNMALSYTVFELFDSEYCHDLEIWVRGHSMSFKLVPFKILGAVSYSPSIVTMAPSCIIFEKKRDIGRKSWFFHTPLHSMPLLGGSRRIIAIPFGVGKAEWSGYSMVKKLICLTVSTEYRCVTDRQMDRHLATA